MSKAQKTREAGTRISPSRYSRIATVIALTCAAVIILLVAHACALIPTSRLAPRSFLMNRDYQDMKRVFRKADLPPSFKIARIYHPGNRFIPSPDGPAPILYEATVSAAEFPELVSRISGPVERMADGFEYRRGGALSHFNPALANQLIAQYLQTDNPWTPLILESHTTKTVDGREYGRRSYLAVDDRSSETIRLYIRTIVPYEPADGYPNKADGILP